MNVDGTSLLVSFVIGAIGFVSFSYGRKQGRFPQMLVGLLLMVFPYFVPNVLVTAGIAVALLAALWLMLRMGL